MTRTITAMYDSRQDAEAARRQLESSGLSSGDISIIDQSASGQGAAGMADDSNLRDGGEHKGFFGALKDMFMPEEDRHAYSEGISRGGFLLTARVDEDRVDEAVRLLDSSDAVDFDSRQNEWRQSGWAGYDASTRDRDLTGDRLTEERAIPLAEERLRVGKREVERGSVRVRSYVQETPVHEEVSLREERVDVERRPVNEALRGTGDDVFREREIEMTERGEEAVVGKEAVVTEEVFLRPQTEERVEHIEDTVRHTEVEVDDSGRDGMSMRNRDRDRTGILGTGTTDESRSFSDDADHSIAMDAEGDRVNETDEERRLRLERRDRDMRP